MEDIGYLWTFHESVDELKQKLQYKTLELEMTRKEANEEMKKSNDHIKQLLQLLETTCKERDDAKSKFKKLQSFFSLSNPNFDHFLPISAPFSPDSPLFTNNNNYPTKTNSGFTESNNSFSEQTCINNSQIKSKKSHSHVSSPVVDSQIYPHSTSSPDTIDEGNLVIQKLAKDRPLPQKGKFLQAVIDAGPLLHTLMVAGSLPTWRNPPGPVTQPIPLVNIQVGDSGLGQKNGVGYGQICDGSMGMYQNTSPMLDFGGGSCLMGGAMINSSVNFDCQIPKRQRLV